MNAESDVVAGRGEADAAAGSAPREAPIRPRRQTSAQRHEQVVQAAVLAFAEAGYAGTTTDDIARRVGVSQPYVIRLFGTKQALFLAAVDRACDRIEGTFRDAAATRPDLATLGQAYRGLLVHRELLLVLLHGFAASGDPAIGPVVQGRYGAIYRLVRELTGADAGQARDFLATGMLLTILSAMDVLTPEATGKVRWADELMTSLRTHPPGRSSTSRGRPRQRPSER